MLIQIQLFISMQIQIQGAKPMRIHVDRDPGQSLKSQKNFTWKILKVGNRSKNIGTYEGTKAFFFKWKKPVLFVNLVNLHAPGSGSAFLIQIQI